MRRGHPGGFDYRRHVPQPAYCRLPAQGLTTFRRAANYQLEQRLATKSIAVIGVFIAAGDRQHPEQQHLINLMADLSTLTTVANALRQDCRYSEAAFSLP